MSYPNEYGCVFCCLPKVRLDAVLHDRAIVPQGDDQEGNRKLREALIQEVKD